ncbi:serine/threonine-protein kinase S6KL-like [Nilaparvata lugens]|uniref:serine/threonine-protein kinase S6KL-like n=1 Tax=Nilaparvata lugens TaxID=108931 RepID=UPI00193E54E2|nr:serine/threonine-protein kinase S6KL-like [Nilaparvata lugens]
MGNSDSKTSSPTCNSRRERKSKSIYSSFSDFSLVNLASNLSGRSFASGATQHSTTSTNRPWSRVSRHRWRQSTLDNPLEASKTAWPVSHVEALFLPEFKIKEKNTFNFELVGTIAKGAFGRVFKVLKVDNDEVYAMKVLSKARIISENAIQQVKDEVRIQSMCGHNPFIVNCPYFWQTRKKLFIVSNFVSGGELLSLCQVYGSLPEQLVAIYVAEIALALDFLHNSGVIYRDLKLENVLLDEEGHTQLIDFGLAKWLPYNKRTSTICGTLQYMAPEILSVENGYSTLWTGGHWVFLPVC